MNTSYSLTLVSNYLQTIHPSLQAAARGMDGAAFCAFTEQVRDHYAAGHLSDLFALFESRNVRPSMTTVKQNPLRGRPA